MTDEEFINQQAYLALEGLHHDIAGALIRLLESDCAIEVPTRKKLAKAFSKTSADDGIRLEVRGEGSGKKDNPAYQSYVRERWIAAARHMEDLQAGGMTQDEAKRHVTEFNMGPSQAGNARRFYLRAKE